MVQATDVASGTITTTTTSGPFTLSGNSGGTAAFVVVINVTAVSGAGAAMDVAIEVQDDGARWYKLFDLPRITAAGQYSTPELRTDGRTYRVVQTIIRNSLPFLEARNICQMIDRTLNPNTAGSATQALYVDGPKDVILVVSLGAATTPPAIQLEASEDNGATWAAISSPVTAAANGTVRIKALDEYPRHVRATVATAGSGATLGYVLIKAVG